MPLLRKESCPILLGLYRLLAEVEPSSLFEKPVVIDRDGGGVALFSRIPSFRSRCVPPTCLSNSDTTHQHFTTLQYQSCCLHDVELSMNSAASAENPQRNASDRSGLRWLDSHNGHLKIGKDHSLMQGP
jgi:hypothetical protein